MAPKTAFEQMLLAASTTRTQTTTVVKKNGKYIASTLTWQGTHIVDEDRRIVNPRRLAEERRSNVEKHQNADWQIDDAEFQARRQRQSDRFFIAFLLMLALVAMVGVTAIIVWPTISADFATFKAVEMPSFDLATFLRWLAHYV